jgi:dTDP-4-dehydrorhamnose reductase
MKKVLITGSNGLLGQKLLDLYIDEGRVELIASSSGANRYPKKVGYQYCELDITKSGMLHSAIEQFQPHCIINTAAMTNVDACEANKSGCNELNVKAVEYLVESANRVNAQLIQLSTDFIFDGAAGPYAEEAEPNPLSYYGLSKLRSEEIIKQNCKNWAIARTILVYGIVNDMGRSNIVLWAKNALEKGDPIRVVNDQYRMPTLADDLANGCKLIEEQEAKGVFNISGKDLMSITELVERVADFFGKDKSLIEEISSEALNQAAKRPPKTGFLLDKSRQVLGYEPHSFEDGLMILKQQLEASF